MAAAQLGRAFSLDPAWVRPLGAITDCTETAGPDLGRASGDGVTQDRGRALCGESGPDFIEETTSIKWLENTTPRRD